MSHLVTTTFIERVRAEYQRLRARGLTAGEAIGALSERLCSNRLLLEALVETRHAR